MAFDFPIGLLLILLSDNGVYTNSCYDFFFIKIPDIVWHWFSKSNIRSFED